MRTFAALLASVLVVASTAGADDKTVKVFILSGQSNMVGWAHARTLPRLGEDKAHAKLWKKLSKKKGSWVERDDVWIDACVDDKVRRGKLSVGYGGGDGGEWLGPEFAFGVEMGDRYEEPVLLIKAAWGGKDLFCDFRPPSAGAPDYEIPLRDDKPRDQGAFYRRLVQEVTRGLADMGENFPKLRKRKPELCGFVWFQGWNEMYAGDEIQDTVYDEYASNFAHLVEDLRREFDAPHLPVVVGELGVNGEDVNDNMKKLRDAQADIPKQKPLRGTSSFVRTAPLWDQEVDDAFRHKEDVKGTLFRELKPKIEKKLKRKLRGKDKKEAEKLVRNETNKLVREHKKSVVAEEEWERVGSHWECHYHGSAKIYCLIGQALGEGMAELVTEQRP